MISYTIETNTRRPSYLRVVNESLNVFLDYIVKEVNAKVQNIDETRNHLVEVIETLPIKLIYVDQMDGDMNKMSFTYHNSFGIHTQVVFNIIGLQRDIKLSQILSE